MTDIHVLTWNLCKRDAAFQVLTRHVAARCLRGDAFIIALQECAEDAEAIAHEIRRLGGASVYAVGNGTLSVLASQPLELADVPEDTVGGRLILTGARFDGRRIAIVDYHGMAQGMAGSLAPEERGGVASEARWHLDEHAKGDPVIVLGDFNVQPTDVEVASRFCLSFAAEPSQASTKSHGRRRALIRAVHPSPGAGIVKGSYLWSSTTQGVAWRMLDFGAVSDGISLALEVFTLLDGEPLMQDGEPETSDHLPVGGTLRLV